MTTVVEEKRNEIDNNWMAQFYTPQEMKSLSLAIEEEMRQKGIAFTRLNTGGVMSEFTRSKTVPKKEDLLKFPVTAEITTNSPIMYYLESQRGWGLGVLYPGKSSRVRLVVWWLSCKCAKCRNRMSFSLGHSADAIKAVLEELVS